MGITKKDDLDERVDDFFFLSGTIFILTIPVCNLSSKIL